MLLNKIIIHLYAYFLYNFDIIILNDYKVILKPKVTNNKNN